jgi:hypothetical protein
MRAGSRDEMPDLRSDITDSERVILRNGFNNDPSGVTGY